MKTQVCGKDVDDGEQDVITFTIKEFELKDVDLYKLYHMLNLNLVTACIPSTSVKL